MHETPIPGVAWNPSTTGSIFDTPLARAASVTARPTGCSLAASAAEARASTESFVFAVPYSMIRAQKKQDTDIYQIYHKHPITRYQSVPQHVVVSDSIITGIT